MVYPPPTLATSRTNSTVSSNTHKDDHNAANLAINDITTHLQKRTHTHRSVYVTSGNIAMSNTAWAPLAATQLVIPAVVGERLEFGVNALVGNQSNSVSYFDVGVYVSGSLVRRLGGTDGLGGWLCMGAEFRTLSGSAFLTIATGDVAAGQATLQLMCRGATSTSRTLWANTANNPLHVFVKNLGPE